MNIKKAKKKELIKIIEQYEKAFEEIQNASDKDAEKVYIVIDKEEDNKTITYIKKKLKSIKNKQERKKYENELRRLTDIYQENVQE